MKLLKRRSFLKHSTVSSFIVPFFIGKQGSSANETIHIGCIGTGGRCRRLIRDLAHIPNTKITAVCDVWDQHLEQAKAMAGDNAMETKNYEEVLGRNDIDAILIATPNHLHVPILVASCEAGKDVYV